MNGRRPVGGGCGRWRAGRREAPQRQRPESATERIRRKRGRHGRREVQLARRAAGEESSADAVVSEREERAAGGRSSSLSETLRATQTPGIAKEPLHVKDAECVN